MPNDLVDIPGVELARVGTWRLSTGPAVFTAEKFAAAIDAINTCPAIRQPALKLGHTYIDGVVQLGHTNRGGQPALGWADNLRIDGDVLRGDYRGLPAKFAARQADGHSPITSAYPNCSIEGYEDGRCRLGHQHPFVITGVTLIGADEPAATLTDLRDVMGLYGIAAAAEVPDDGTPFGGPPLLPADIPTVDVDDVQRIAAASQTTADTGGEPDNRKDTRMPSIAELFGGKVGLPDATDEQVIEALNKHLDEKPTETAEVTDTNTAGEVGDVAQLVAAAADKAAQDAVKPFAAALEQATGELAAIKAEKATETKTALFAAAVSEGRIAPAEREHLEKEYDEAPGVITRLINAKAKGSAVPIAASGYSVEPELGNEDVEFDNIIGNIRAGGAV